DVRRDARSRPRRPPPPGGGIRDRSEFAREGRPPAERSWNVLRSLRERSFPSVGRGGVIRRAQRSERRPLAERAEYIERPWGSPAPWRRGRDGVQWRTGWGESRGVGHAGRRALSRLPGAAERARVRRAAGGRVPGLPPPVHGL